MVMISAFSVILPFQESKTLNGLGAGIPSQPIRSLLSISRVCSKVADSDLLCHVLFSLSQILSFDGSCCSTAATNVCLLLQEQITSDCSLFPPQAESFFPSSVCPPCASTAQAMHGTLGCLVDSKDLADSSAVRLFWNMPSGHFCVALSKDWKHVVQETFATALMHARTTATIISDFETSNLCSRICALAFWYHRSVICLQLRVSMCTVCWANECPAFTRQPDSSTEKSGAGLPTQRLLVLWRMMWPLLYQYDTNVSFWNCYRRETCPVRTLDLMLYVYQMTGRKLKYLGCW